MEQAKKQIPQYSAEQYLMTAFSRADWIQPEYKQLSTLCRENPLALRELYLCACDNVSIEAVRIAVSNEPMEENLKKVRSKHFEKIYLDMHQFYVNELTETVDALRKEVGTVSSAAKKFAETIPSLEELFSSVPPVGQSGQTILNVMEQPTHTAGDDEKMMSSENFTEEKVLEHTAEISKNSGFFANLFKKEIRPAKLLEELYQKQYNDEQINYIIGCMEDGLSEKEIRSFISPNFDIDTMKRLRKLYVKEEQHGKR